MPGNCLHPSRDPFLIKLKSTFALRLRTSSHHTTRQAEHLYNIPFPSGPLEHYSTPSYSIPNTTDHNCPCQHNQITRSSPDNLNNPILAHYQVFIHHVYPTHREICRLWLHLLCPCRPTLFSCQSQWTHRSKEGATRRLCLPSPFRLPSPARCRL